MFDEPNAMSFGVLPAVMGLAEHAGLRDLVDEHVTVPGTVGSNVAIKVSGLVAAMIVGADSIADLDVLRHGGMVRMFDGLRAATTLGTHLRGYRFRPVQQVDAVASRLLANLAGLSPILEGVDQLTFVDVDDSIRQTHRYRQQGAAYGYSGVKGLNAQLETVSTLTSAPVIAGARFWGRGIWPAIIESVFADLKHGPLAHAPAGSAPTMPGSPWPRSRSTSPRSPHNSPRRHSGGPAPRPYVAPSSLWEAGSRTVPDTGSST